ncbi:MAG: hypothetical protein ACREOG_11770, partial [Gemmatimonadaceae bacterium]
LSRAIPWTFPQRTEANMLSLKSLRIGTIVSAIVMAMVGLGAATMPLKAQNQALLCHYLFPGCNQPGCQDLCDDGFPGSTGFCQGPQGECCNCYY